MNGFRLQEKGFRESELTEVSLKGLPIIRNRERGPRETITMIGLCVTMYHIFVYLFSFCFLLLFFFYLFTFFEYSLYFVLTFLMFKPQPKIKILQLLKSLLVKILY